MAQSSIWVSHKDSRDPKYSGIFHCLTRQTDKQARGEAKKLVSNQHKDTAWQCHKQPLNTLCGAMPAPIRPFLPVLSQTSPPASGYLLIYLQNTNQTPLHMESPPSPAYMTVPHVSLFFLLSRHNHSRSLPCKLKLLALLLLHHTTFANP